MNISQEKFANWCRKGQRLWKTRQINFCMYIKDQIFRNILLLSCARALPFVLRNTRAHWGIVHLRTLLLLWNAKERGNSRMIALRIGRRLSRQSSRKFHCRWKNRDYGRTTRSLPPLLWCRAFDSADSFGFRRQQWNEMKQHVLLCENTIARIRRVEQTFRAQMITWAYRNIDVRSYVFIWCDTRYEEYI